MTMLVDIARGIAAFGGFVIIASLFISDAVLDKMTQRNVLFLVGAAGILLGALLSAIGAPR